MKTFTLTLLFTCAAFAAEPIDTITCRSAGDAGISCVSCIPSAYGPVCAPLPNLPAVRTLFQQASNGPSTEVRLRQSNATRPKHVTRPGK